MPLFWYKFTEVLEKHVTFIRARYKEDVKFLPDHGDTYHH
jgi:hypothetical protein